MVEHDRKLWLLGGFGESKGRYNDLRCYNIDTHNWELIPMQPNTSASPRPLYLHSAVVWHGQMWVFGGSCSKDSNSLYSFNFSTLTWEHHAPQPHCPTPRYGHAACVIGDMMYVVGGCQHNSKYHTDCYGYNLINKQWARLPDVPVELAYHSLATHNDKLYLIGGYNGKRFSPYTYQLDLTRRMWVPVNCTGQVPSPLCGAAVMVDTAQNELYMFGGYTAHGHTNETYRLSFGTMSWERMAVQNKPVSRAYLQASLVDNTIYLFGGYDGTHCISDFRTLHLSKPIDVLQCILEHDIQHQVAYVMKHFANNRTPSKQSTSSVLDRKNVEALLRNLGSHISIMNNAQQQTVTRYPFDTSRMQDLMDLGFTRQQVIDCLTKCHNHGINTDNFEAVVHQLLDMNVDDNHTPDANGHASVTPGNPVTSDGMNSKHDSSHLNGSMATSSNQRDDHRMCKIW